MNASGVTGRGDDDVIVFVVAAVAAMTVIGSVGAFWWTGVGWLVEHHVLAPAAGHPVFVLPACAGAGLDGARLAIGAGIVVAFMAMGVSTVHHRLAARREMS